VVKEEVTYLAGANRPPELRDNMPDIIRPAPNILGVRIRSSRGRKRFFFRL
jgi:hypothetical protein